MNGISLESALEVARRIKAGESVSSVMLGGVEYFPRTKVYFVSGLATAIENTELVLAKNAAEPGVRNIDKNMIDFPFLTLSKRMRFDTTTGAGATAATGNYKDDAPIYFDNGSIKVTQDGLLSDLPISVLANKYAATKNEDDFFSVVPYLVRPNKAFNINTSLAGVAVANHVFRLEILGIEFVRNTRA